jgi:hypothetical protein
MKKKVVSRNQLFLAAIKWRTHDRMKKVKCSPFGTLSELKNFGSFTLERPLLLDDLNGWSSTEKTKHLGNEVDQNCEYILES